MKSQLVWLGAMAWMSCAVVNAQQNVLMIIADDLGVDRVGAYAEHPDPGNTPVLDGLAAGGMLFRHAWANPGCSPTRATVLTGRYAHRTGLGNAISFSGSQQELLLEETTLAELLQPTMATWAVGKWHLASSAGSGAVHPLLQGFDTHIGPLANLPGGLVGNGYDSYTKFIDGLPVANNGYATTEQVDDALALIAGATGPWFCSLSFNAAHAPFHAPPAALHSFTLPASIADDIPLAMKAMVEAMDTEIGRLLAGLGPSVLAQTLVVFVGDNGTAGLATTAPFNPAHGKGTIFDGGIRVPLIVAGPGVAVGSECVGLVNTTDLFATIAEAMGVSQTTGDDSVSLVPYFSDPGQPSLRNHIYSEWFFTNGQGPFLSRRRTARDDRYKLNYDYGANASPQLVEFFDLTSDPFEANDLLQGSLGVAEQSALVALQSAMDGLDTFVPWQTLGTSLAGDLGPPVLVATGALGAGETLGFLVSNTPPLSGVVRVVGFANISFAFSGGVMVPSPDVLLTLGTDAAGAMALTAVWPAGVPAGLTLFLQDWVLDASGPAGFTSTRAVMATTVP